MSSDSESVVSEVGEQSTNFRFVEALANHKVLFNKSQLPTIKKAKENALIIVQESYQLMFGRTITIKQLKKKIQNMKNELKKKIDKKATGNKKIILKDWEKKLLEIMDSDVQNPVLNKIPGAVSTGTTGVHHLPDDNNADISIRPLPPVLPRSIPIQPKKSKFNEKEPDETAKLSTAELQRLVLLEQLKLTRMQIEREQILLNRLRQTPQEMSNYYSVDINSGNVYTDL